MEKALAEKQGGYLIGDVAQMVGMSRDALRFYEKKGIIRADKKENGYRYYSEDDIYRLMYILSFFRKEKNVPEIVTLTYETDWVIEEHDPIHEMLRQLYQMINQLGQLDKSIILLYLEDKSYEDIAEITGLTVTNVATKLSRIKDKLKKMKKE